MLSTRAYPGPGRKTLIGFSASQKTKKISLSFLRLLHFPRRRCGERFKTSRLSFLNCYLELPRDVRSSSSRRRPPSVAKSPRSLTAALRHRHDVTAIPSLPPYTHRHRAVRRPLQTCGARAHLYLLPVTSLPISSPTSQGPSRSLVSLARRHPRPRPPA